MDVSRGRKGERRTYNNDNSMLFQNVRDGWVDGRLLGCPVGDRADTLLMIQHPQNNDSSFNIDTKRESYIWLLAKIKSGQPVFSRFSHGEKLSIAEISRSDGT